MKLFSGIAGLFCFLGIMLLLAWFSARSTERLKWATPAPSPGPEEEGRAFPDADASSIATALPASSAPVFAATPTDLKTLRRAFSPTAITSGTPLPGAPVLELEGYRIHTASGPKLTLAPDRQETLPYIVHFNAPIRPAWRAAVEQAGGIVHGYLPEHALSVDLNAAAAKRLAREPYVQAILPMLADYKLQPFLRHLIDLPADAAPAGPIPVTLSTYTPADVTTVRRNLEAAGLVVEAEATGKRWGWLRVTVPCADLPALAALDRVQWIEEYVAPQIANDLAALGDAMNLTNAWTTHGLTGAGQIIGHADTGLDIGNLVSLHPDFTGRVVAAYALGRPGRWDDPNGHGTHTAGSILGGGVMSTGLYRGVAFEAGLVHQSVIDSGGGLGGLPADLNDLFHQTYTNGARIHANSWGSAVFGSYSTDSRQADEYMWDHPDMLIVFSAGNDGWDSGDGVIDPDSIGAPATAKNVLTVGAAESGRAPGSGGLSVFTYGMLWPWDYPNAPIYGDYISQYADSTHRGMAAFSSRGPTDDGRIKPEVIAPGTDIISTRSQYPGAGTIWGAHPNSRYSFGGGTSMSTPLVAGAAALVREYFSEFRDHENPSAALVKAALMHGAVSIAPGQYGTGAQQEIPAQRPNIVEGWGMVNIGHALFPEDAAWFYIDQTNGFTGPGQDHTYAFHATTGTVRITLLYTDYPSVAGAGRKLVNDLDLVLSGPAAPDAAASRDDTNTVEALEFSITAAGIYTARVEAVNLPASSQPYALIVSGPVIEAPVITHIPLQNQYLTNQPYTVSAQVTGADGASLFWRTAPATNFTRVVMTNTSADRHEATIPAMPVNSMVEYYLAATNAAFRVTDPPTAPAEVHRFNITRSYTLEVSGQPGAVGTVEPPYGLNLIASGATVRVKAPRAFDVAAGIRVANTGYTGSGSIPATGSETTLDLTITTNSAITWYWVTEYALAQTSTVAGLVNTTTWHAAWSSATTVTAPTESGAYGLAGWRTDGARWPTTTAASQNPATGIVMFGPRAAEAVYLTVSTDANGNGLPDWWEQFYFGTNTASAHTDDDFDGFTNSKEYQDRTNPRDATSTPQPPAITHVPLTNPQPLPAPWFIEATLTDNYAVSNAVFSWQRNGGAWTSSVMERLDGDQFVALLPAPGTNGDTFAYRIQATDYAGLTAQNGPFALLVAYPILFAAPATFGTLELPALTYTNTTLAISNAGLATLNWQIQRTLFFDHAEGGTNAWTTDGRNNTWNINASRYASATRAWHFGNGIYNYYPDDADAFLFMPPVHLDAPARLVFNHWAAMEYDTDQNDDHYWDGGVVELSTNGGLSYFMIDPEGGYPHRITANPDAPFEPETPCYGATDGWEPAEFDLSAYAGQTVRIRFRFGSDLYVRAEGWYIDDVRIVYENDDAWTWLTVTATNGTVAAGHVGGATVRFDTSALLPGETRSAVLALFSDDPVRDGPVLVPVGLHNLTREILVTHSPDGTVAPSGTVWVLRGENAAFTISADPFHVIEALYTNGTAVAGYHGVRATNFVWPAVASNGTLSVNFAINMISGLVPEQWLYEQGLTNHAPEIEAATDHDGDGMVAWQEYVATTDPHDADSVAMVVTAVTPGETGPVVTWLSFTNETLVYDLYAATNLVAGFAPVVTNLPATPPLNVFTNPETPVANTYRIMAR